MRLNRRFIPAMIVAVTMVISTLGTGLMSVGSTSAAISEPNGVRFARLPFSDSATDGTAKTNCEHYAIARLSLPSGYALALYELHRQVH